MIKCDFCGKELKEKPKHPMYFRAKMNIMNKEIEFIGNVKMNKDGYMQNAIVCKECKILFTEERTTKITYHKV